MNKYLKMIYFLKKYSDDNILDQSRFYGLTRQNHDMGHELQNFLIFLDYFLFNYIIRKPSDGLNFV
jgi:hypothetical protein